MKEIVSKFLLAGDKSIPEICLRQPRFTYSACGPFTGNNERIKKNKEAGDSRYIYQSELYKAWLQHDMTYRNFKGLTRRTASGCVIKHLILLKIRNMLDINTDFLQ